MFEKYNEQARRIIAFATFEVSDPDDSVIKTEHLLLGLLRENGALVSRFLPAGATMETIRQRIGQNAAPGSKFSAPKEFALNIESKRVLAFATEEAGPIGARSHRSGPHVIGNAA